ncbi:APC family permease [Staphylococcus gallinarum]|uniref:Amino acid permease n=1 Tax=Staphylococcus gallinarum TaxID=1293 RepID=A0A2T4T016_STAGA|nr:APC family permease [Staphylococcus gallinarum]MCD8827575.1 APC family permease [Staphylococcus gallinarum]MCD8829495.1 APC family permease [Staphylococcus gallinarum]MCD8870878.1 APC family permease [Staphylococcus gallinarum]MCD8901023.1 APC family permease [Staphylococcus gallinarum]MCD8902615.1 APC family permease [Staphylococcus gallinarum]
MKSQFNKTMNVVDVLFLAIGAMLGWGWVVLSGEWVSTAGFVGSIIAFVIGGILVIVIGLTYAELASAIPETGGGFVFVKKAFSPGIAFISGWSVLFGYVSVITFEAVALPTVIDYVIPFKHQGLMWNIAGWDVYFTWVLIGSVGSIILTSLNYFGVKPAAIMQTVFTIFIVAVGLLLVFGAGFNGNFSHLTPFENGLGGTMSVLMMIPFLFVGFDVIPQIAEEVKAPSKKIGGILILSIIASVIFYLLIVFGVAAGLSPKALTTSNLATADAMVNLFGHSGFGVLLVLGGVAGIITSWNAFIIGGSRILYAMANNGMIPKWFAYIHPKYKTPTHGIIFLGVLAFVAPLLGRPALVWIVNAGGIGVVLGYLLVAISFIKLRKSQPDLKRPYHIRNGMFVGIVAIVLSVGFLLIYMPGMPSSLAWPSEWLIVIAWYLIALVLYMTQGSRKHSDEHVAFTKNQEQ